MKPSNPTGSSPEPMRILLDLKPALDGYAGIPQESRLLFRCLRALDNCSVEGLIQHGARKLGSEATTVDQVAPASVRADHSSRLVVAMRGSAFPVTGTQPGGGGGSKAGPRAGGVSWFGVLRVLSGYLSIPGLALRALVGRPVSLGIFEGGLFEDFLWRGLFEKTLRPADKALVTSAPFRVLNLPRKTLHQVGLVWRWLGMTPRYLRVDTRGFDVLLAQTPFPGRVSAGTRLVVRYHDSIPVLMPHTIKESAFHQASHFCSLRENVRSGAWFSCVSEVTRADLLKLFPEVEGRSSVVHDMVSDEYREEAFAPDLVGEIIQNRVAEVPGVEARPRSPDGPQERYILMVSTLEPRKNHLLLVAAWELLTRTTMPRLKLVIVGNRGWGDGPILAAMRPGSARGDLFLLHNVPASELRVLYRHAAATICPSLCEGFDYSGVESMRSGGIVIASDIPVHREVYAEAAAYFNPYDIDDAAAVIGQTLAEEASPAREGLRRAGAEVAHRYTSEYILPQWDAFLQTLVRRQASGA